MKPTGFLVVVASLALASCASPPADWHYRPGEVSVTDQPLPVRVAVLPFEDARGVTNSDGSLAFLIPIAPFGLVDHSRIEDGTGFISYSEYRVDPRRDLARALATELQSSNLFNQVTLVDEARFAAGARRDVDFYLTGRVRGMRYTGGTVSYFLSVFAPIFWVFGAPSGYSTNDLELEVVLRRAHDHEIVWRGSPFSGGTTQVMGLYYNSGTEFDGYPALMAAACRRWIDELYLDTRRSPEEFAAF